MIQRFALVHSLSLMTMVGPSLIGLSRTIHRLREFTAVSSVMLALTTTSRVCYGHVPRPAHGIASADPRQGARRSSLEDVSHSELLSTAMHESDSPFSMPNLLEQRVDHHTDCSIATQSARGWHYGRCSAWRCCQGSVPSGGFFSSSTGWCEVSRSHCSVRCLWLCR